MDVPSMAITQTWTDPIDGRLAYVTSELPNSVYVIQPGR